MFTINLLWKCSCYIPIVKPQVKVCDVNISVGVCAIIACNDFNNFIAAA